MNAIERVEPNKTGTDSSVALMRLIEVSIEKGLSPTEAYAMLKEERAQQARGAFAVALSRLQAVVGTIVRNKEAEIASRSGRAFTYHFADLDAIFTAIEKPMADNALSVTFRLEETKPGTLLATAEVFHRGGHSISSSFPCPIETSAGMSPQQKYASAATFAKRNALAAVLGLRTGDPDRDGAEIVESGGEVLTDEQQLVLDDLIKTAGTDPAKVWAFGGCSGLDTFPAAKFDAATKKLRTTIATKGTK